MFGLMMNTKMSGDKQLDEKISRIRAKAENAYIEYISILRRDTSLGWEIKLERKEFGEAELKSHCAAAEMLGRHRALNEVIMLLEE